MRCACAFLSINSAPNSSQTAGEVHGEPHATRQHHDGTPNSPNPKLHPALTSFNCPSSRRASCSVYLIPNDCNCKGNTNPRSAIRHIRRAITPHLLRFYVAWYNQGRIAEPGPDARAMAVVVAVATPQTGAAATRAAHNVTAQYDARL
jgi:hypothetical protein